MAVGMISCLWQCSHGYDIGLEAIPTNSNGGGNGSAPAVTGVTVVASLGGCGSDLTIVATV